MLDSVREVLDGARRSLLFWRILRGSVRLCEVGDDDLGVALRAEGTRLEERLLEEDTTLVHVQTRLDIIQSVGDTVDAAKEVLVVDVYNI